MGIRVGRESGGMCFNPAYRIDTVQTRPSYNLYHAV